MDKKVLILRSILENGSVTQRELSGILRSSLGSTNKLTAELKAEGLLKEKCGGMSDGTSESAVPEAKTKAAQPHRRQMLEVTPSGLDYLKPYRTEKALILSAGFGSRFVPLTYETPKGLLKVFGEPMIERQIKQLHEVGVTDITIMVGYLKESFEYLRDLYGVKFIYNPEYSKKNTLSTLWHAREVLRESNCYILSSDNWLRENLYHSYEGGAWYCAAHSDGPTAEWTLVSDKKGRITDTYPGGRDCDYMYGPVYFSREFSRSFLPVLEHYYEIPGTEQYYWENVLMEMLNGTAVKRITAYYSAAEAKRCCREPEMYVNLQEDGIVYEFENLEELRHFDSKYINNSESPVMQLVSRVFGVPEGKIENIK